LTTKRSPALDDAAARALAVVTLFATGADADAVLAERLLDELATQDGSALARGLVSVAAALLVLHEYETGSLPHQSLQAVGQMVAYAMQPC
jgi:hypothetical protein